MSDSAHIRRLNAPICELGEGPTYDRANDTAWWFDILGKKLFSFDFTTQVAQTEDLPYLASLVCQTTGGQQLLAMENGLYLRAPKDSALKLLHPLEADNPATRSNDGRVHPSGRLWIGTMGKSAESEAGAIYWFDGVELRKLFSDITIPNSICFSPDGTRAYFADTIVNSVWRVAVDPQNGLPVAAPELFLTGANLPLGGSFDGSVVDAAGVLWNAAWGGGSVTGFSPDGDAIATYQLPVPKTTCPCFVGGALDTLLVTSAWEGDTLEQRRQHPDAGSTFVIEGPFQGLEATPFKSDAQ